jgi:hypothetical protein
MRRRLSAQVDAAWERLDDALLELASLGQISSEIAEQAHELCEADRTKLAAETRNPI